MQKLIAFKAGATLLYTPDDVLNTATGEPIGVANMPVDYLHISLDEFKDILKTERVPQECAVPSKGFFIHFIDGVKGTAWKVEGDFELVLFLATILKLDNPQMFAMSNGVYGWKTHSELIIPNLRISGCGMLAGNRGSTDEEISLLEQEGRKARERVKQAYEKDRGICKS